ncbi:MAG TPA: YcfL family protein [Opitutaceae bacterium]
MTSRHPFSLLAALGALALLAGCGTAPAPQAPQDSTKFTVENTDRFVALDPATEAVISCTGLQERTLADGRIEVVANLRNSGTKAAKVQVQCVFLDAQGTPVGDSAPWQSVSITESATEVVRFTAPGPSAIKYSIRVRRAR